MNSKTVLVTVGFSFLMLFAITRGFPQSGRGQMHGYVAFEDVSYNELSAGKLHAKVELRSITEANRGGYKTETNNTGSYDFPQLSLGEYVLRITAPGYKTYQTEIFIPSDFNCNLATMMKRESKN